MEIFEKGEGQASGRHEGDRVKSKIWKRGVVPGDKRQGGKFDWGKELAGGPR